MNQPPTFKQAMYRLRRQIKHWADPKFCRKMRQLAAAAEAADAAGDLTEEQRFLLWTLQEELREAARRAKPLVAMLNDASKGISYEVHR